MIRCYSKEKINVEIIAATGSRTTYGQEAFVDQNVLDSIGTDEDRCLPADHVRGR